MQQWVKLFSLPGNPSPGEPDEHNNENKKNSYNSADTIKGDNNDNKDVLRCIHVFRCACLDWNKSSDVVKEAWRARGKHLNSQKIPGKFYRVPNVIGRWEQKWETMAMEVLTVE